MKEKEVVDEFDFSSFQRYRTNLLLPIADPDSARVAAIFFEIRNVVLVLALSVLLMSFLAYLATGNYIIPWWVFLLIGGVLASTILLDDEPDSVDLVDQLRESNRDLYSDLDSTLSTKLGAKG